MKSRTSSGGIHVAPRRTPMSAGPMSGGRAARSASALPAKAGSAAAAASATRSFARTLPDRYSSAGCHSGSPGAASGARNIWPASPAATSSSETPVSRAI